MQFDIEQLTRYSNARLQRNDGIGLNKDRSIAIVYEVPLGAGTDTIGWLQDNRRTIKDVVVDHQDVVGLWRSVGFQSEQSIEKKGFSRIIQSFKHGWITELTSSETIVEDEEITEVTSIIWDEARVVRSNEFHEGTDFGEFPEAAGETNNPMKYHLVEWHGVDPEKIEEIRTAIRNTPPSGVSPVINGENYGSGFYILDVISEIVQDEQQPDKSGKITVLFAKPRFNMQAWENYGTPTQSKLYWLYDVPTLIAQSLINIYNKRTGTSVEATQPDQRGLLTIRIKDKIENEGSDASLTGTSCATFTRTVYHYGLNAPLSVPDNQMGRTYRGRFELVRQEGTYSGWIEESVAQTQKVGPYRSQNTHGFYEDTTNYKSVYVDGSEYKSATLSISGGEIITALASIPDLPLVEIEKGETWRLTKRVNDDCTCDLEYTERYEKSVDDIEYDTSDSAAAKGTATEKFNKESAEVTLVAGANEVLRANVRVNKDTGLLDVTEEKTVSKQLDGEEQEENLFQKRNVTRKRNTATEPLEPVQEVGKVKSTSKEETEFQGRYNTTESVVEGIAVQDASKSKMTMPFEVRESVTNRNQTNPLPYPDTQTVGRVDEVRNDKNEFGLYDVTQSSRIATPQDGSERTKRETAISVEESDTDRNQIAPITEEEIFDIGTVIQTRSVENEYALFDNTKSVAEAKPYDIKVPEWKPSIDEVTKQETHINLYPEELSTFLTGALARPTHGIDFTEADPEMLRGVRRSITVDINQDGTLNVRGQSNEPDAAGDELDPPIGEEFTVLHDMGMYWNQTKDEILDILATLADQEVGKNKRVEIRRNDLGRFDMTVSIRTHRAYTAPTATTTGSGIQLEVNAGINAESAITISSNQRERVSLDVSPNERGQFNWRSTKQTVIETPSTLIGTNARKLLYGTNTSAPTIPADHIYSGGNVSPNDDGTYSFNLSLKDITDPTRSEFSSGSGGVSVEQVAVSGGTELDADAEAIGISGERQQVSVSLRPNEDGTVDYVVNRQTVKETTQTLIGDNARKLLYGSNTIAPSIPVNHVYSGGSVSPNDDGTFSFNLSLKDIEDPSTDSATSGSGGIVTEHVAATGAAVGDVALESFIEGGARKRVSVSIQPQEDGTINYSVTRQTVQEVLSGVVGSGTGVVDTVKVYANKDVIPVATAAEARKRVQHSIQPNDDGTYSGSERITTVVENEGTLSLERRTIYYGKNADATPTITSGVGEDLRLVSGSISGNDDGTVDYNILVKDASDPASGIIEVDVPIGSTGIRVKQESIASANQDEVNALQDGYDAGPRKRHQVSVRPNEDGTIDATVSETEVESATFTSAPDWGDATPEGIIESVQSFSNNDDLPTLPLPAPRKRVSSNIQANDDGTVSGTYRTVEVVESANEYDNALVIDDGKGILETLMYGSNADDGDMPAITAGYRKRHQISAQAQDDGTISYSIRETQIRDVEEDRNISAGTETGLAKRVLSGRNIDPDALDVLIAGLVSSELKEYDLNLQGNDDGTINYTIQEITKKATSGDSYATDGSEGISYEAKLYKNIEPSTLTTLGDSGYRKRITANISAKDDGAIDATIVKQTVAKTLEYSKETTVPVGETGGVKVEITSHKNIDPSELADLGDALIRERVSANLSPNDDGTIDATIQKQTVVETNSYVLATTGSDGISVELAAHKNIDPDDLSDLGASAIRKRISANVSPNDDGSIDATIQKQTVKETSGVPIATSGSGIQTSITAHKNRDIGDVTTLGVINPRDRLSASVSVADDGSQDVTIQKQTVVETIDTHETTSGTGGIRTKLFFGTNVDNGDEPEITAAYRTRHQISINAKDDGTRDYSITEVEIEDVEQDRSIAATGATGIGKRVLYGKSVDPANLTAALNGLVPSSTIDYDLSVSGNDDGTLNYIVTEITKKEREETFNIGNLSEAVELTIGRNKDDLADPTTPSARGVDISLDAQFKDDGSIYYVQRKTTKSGIGLRIDAGGGSLLQSTTTKTMINDADQLDIDESGLAATEGNTVQLGVRLKPDGTADWTKIITTSQGFSTSALAMANLRPEWQSNGYEDTVTLFEYETRAGLSGYFIYAGTTYGYVDGIRVHNDGTVSGKAVTRTYTVDRSLWDERSLPSGQRTLTRVIEKFARDRSTGYEHLYTCKVEYDYKWATSADFVNATLLFAGGMTECSIREYTTPDGQKLWYSQAIMLPTYGAWVDQGAIN